MSEQIREQISAFLDGELPGSETELLLKRLTRDPQLRESFGRYALIGEALRGSSLGLSSKGFAGRVTLAIDGETASAASQPAYVPPPRWWRPLAGAAVAAGVAGVALFALQQRAIVPATRVASAPAAASALATREPITYTVPIMPASRLTNYVFAHSKYSSLLGQRGVLADLLIEDDPQPAANPASAMRPTLTPASHVVP